MPEETNLGTLLDSYAKVLRTHADMDFSQSCDRDWKNLQTLLVERPEICERTISYLINALQDAAEKRMTSRAEHNARSPRIDTSVIKAVDHDGEVDFHYVVVDKLVPVIKDFICGLEGADLHDAVWHRERGWLPKTRSPILEEVEAFNKAVNVSWGLPHRRAAVFGGDIEIVDVDLVEVDAENARDRARLSAFLNCVLAEPWVDSDVDGDPFEITDPEEKAFPCWHDMETQSDGLIERPDGYRIAICRIRHTREGFKLGFSGPFRDMFRGHFRRYYPDLDSAKTAAEDIFRSGLESHGLALAY
ncbi:hypothetical protein [Shinella sp.]|uniref:hypothetical protein n=1 Tax=Shinella sp. TaxID=1870904 RepID=UPI0039E331EA